jgi:hypothetical protein
MNGGSTIGVPVAPIALPNISQCTGTEAQPASEGRGRIAARTRSDWHVVILERALVDGARIGAGQALGPRPSALEGWGLVGRGREANGGE